MDALHVHEAVIASGKTISWCTVHFCDNKYLKLTGFFGKRM